jgi:C4-type Zn-finger protein
MGTPIVRQPGQPSNGNPPNVTDGDKPCPKCGCGLVALSWSAYAPHRKHIRVTCVACTKWLYWAPQTDSNVALADAAPSTD